MAVPLSARANCGGPDDSDVTARNDRGPASPPGVIAPRPLGVVCYGWTNGDEDSPRARTLEVMRNVNGHWTVVGAYSDDDLIRAEPFAEIEIDLSALWHGMPTFAMEPARDYDSL